MITYTPVGVVRSPEKLSRKGRFDQVEAEVVVDEDLTDGLVGLEEFSHIEVIFAIHQPEPTIERERLGLSVHPRGDPDLPAVGLFATRDAFKSQMPGRLIGETVDASLHDYARESGLLPRILDDRTLARLQYFGMLGESITLHGDALLVEVAGVAVL